MALPNSTYSIATVPNPTNTLTDFTLKIDLANLPQSWWDEVDSSDGARGRAAIDGVTPIEVPVDWIDFDNINQTGQISIMWTGNLATVGTQKIRVYPPKLSNTLYAKNDPYGGYNAYDSSWVGYWPDGGGVDRTANGRDGTGTGSPTFGGVSGQFGTATDYNGSSQYSTILASTDDPFANANSMTVSGWFSPDALTADQRGIARWFNTQQQFILWMDTGGAGAGWAFVLSCSGGLARAGEDSANASSGTYQHVVGSYSSSSGVAVTVNAGTPVTAAANGTIDAEAIDTKIASANSEYFNGKINDIVLSSTVRSADWITYDYNQTNDNATWFGTWDVITPLSTLYAKATVPNPTATLTDFSFLIDLVNLPQSWWDAVDTTVGEKGRVYIDDTSNPIELPSNWINFDSSNQTGIVRFKLIGDIDSTSNIDIRIYPPVSTNATYDATHTYGSNNAYDSNWVGYYPINQNQSTYLKDYSPNDYTGTLNGSTAISTINNRISLPNLTGSGVSIMSDNPLDGSNSLTLIADVINTISIGRDRGLFYFDTHTGTDPLLWWIDYTASKNTIAFLANTNGTGDAVAYYSGAAITYNNRYYLATTYDNTNIRLYINSIEDTSGDFPAAMSGNITNSDTPSYTIGNDDSLGETKNFIGYMYQIQVHNTARSQAWLDEEYSQTNDNVSFWGTWSIGNSSQITPDTIYAKASVPNPTDTLTDFSLLVDLSILPSNWWAAVDTNIGAKGRVYIDDINTPVELPTDWIDFDSTNGTGLVRFKLIGNIDTTSNIDIRIYPPVSTNSTIPSYGITGSDNAYDTNWVGYWPDGGSTDHISINDGSSINGAVLGGATGLIGNATEYSNDSSQGSDIGTKLDIYGTFTITSLYKPYTLKDFNTIISSRSSSAYQYHFRIRTLDASSTYQPDILVSGGSEHSATSILPNNWYASSVCYKDTTKVTFALNNTLDYITTSIASSAEELTSGNTILGNRNDLVSAWDGLLQHVSIHDSTRSDSWLLFENSQLIDNSTFWGSWTLGNVTDTIPNTIYAKATLTNPTEILTDFSLLIDLSTLPTTWWDVIDTNIGAKGRVYIDDVTNPIELPTDWINFDSTNNKGTVRFKFLGDIDTTTSIDIRIYPPVAVNPTYDSSNYFGSNNVYDSNWVGYWPDGAGNDRTINVYDMTGTNITEGNIAGKIGYGTSYDGSSSRADTLINLDYPVTMMGWCRQFNAVTGGMLGGWGDKDTADNQHRLYYSTSAGDMIRADSYDGVLNYSYVTLSASDASGWNHYCGRWSANNNRSVTLNATDTSSNTASTTVTGADRVTLGVSPDSTPATWLNGYLNEVSIHNTIRSSGWLSYEYTQTNNNVSFWGTWSIHGSNPSSFNPFVRFRKLAKINSFINRFFNIGFN